MGIVRFRIKIHQPIDGPNHSANAPVQASGVIATCSRIHIVRAIVTKAHARMGKMIFERVVKMQASKK